MSFLPAICAYFFKITEFNGLEWATICELIKKSHCKLIFLQFFIWCANSAKHFVQKGKQHISKEQTEQLTQNAYCKKQDKLIIH